jgi:hypothetical protein
VPADPGLNNMETMNTLQEVINKRAENRLEKDLADMGIMLGKNRLTAAINGSTLETEKYPRLGIMVEGKRDEVVPFRTAFGADMQGNEPRVYGVYLKQLKDYWLPHYIAEETMTFLKRIDEIGDTVDQLREDTDTLQHKVNS